MGKRGLGGNMSPETKKRIQSAGGKASPNNWKNNRKAARRAGRKGGKISRKNRNHD